MDRSLVTREQGVERLGNELGAAFEAIQQPRSDFAIAHFVAGQHDTPARQWAQLVLELQIKVFAIARVRLDVEELESKVVQLRNRLVGFRVYGRDREQVGRDLARASIDLKELTLARLGAVREAETIYRYTKQLEAQHGGPFTYDELQAGEAEYWRLRLARQAYLAARGSIDPGNGEAILQTMIELGETRAELLSQEDLHAMLGVDPTPVPALVLGTSERIMVGPNGAAVKDE